jgi:hypothetical protein
LTVRHACKKKNFFLEFTDQQIVLQLLVEQESRQGYTLLEVNITSQQILSSIWAKPIFIWQENVFSEEDEEQWARRIITLGCVGLHCPQQVIKRHFLLLQHAAYFDPVMLQVNVKSSSQRLLGYSIDKEPLSSKQHIDYSERLDDRWIFKSLPIPFSVAVLILKKRLVWRIKMHFYDWIIQYNTTVEFRLKTRKASLDYLIQYNVWISFQNKEKAGFSFCSNFQFCRKRKGTY